MTPLQTVRAEVVPGRLKKVWVWGRDRVVMVVFWPEDNRGEVRYREVVKNTFSDIDIPAPKNWVII